MAATTGNTVGCGPGAQTVFFACDNGAGFEMRHAHQLFGVFQCHDNPDDVAMTLRALSGANITNHIAVARDGVEALDFTVGDDTHAPTPSTTPRLIVLDLNQANVHGFEVLQRIQSHPVARTIPVVVLTSAMEQRDVVQSYDLGVSSIVKPLDFDRFVTAVGELGVYWLLLNRPAGGA